MGLALILPLQQCSSSAANYQLTCELSLLLPPWLLFGAVPSPTSEVTGVRGEPPSQPVSRSAWGFVSL
jgi:hypothetical protein